VLLALGLEEDDEHVRLSVADAWARGLRRLALLGDSDAHGRSAREVDVPLPLQGLRRERLSEDRPPEG